MAQPKNNKNISISNKLTIEENCIWEIIDFQSKTERTVCIFWKMEVCISSYHFNRKATYLSSNQLKYILKGLKTQTI